MRTKDGDFFVNEPNIKYSMVSVLQSQNEFSSYIFELNVTIIIIYRQGWICRVYSIKQSRKYANSGKTVIHLPLLGYNICCRTISCMYASALFVCLQKQIAIHCFQLMLDWPTFLQVARFEQPHFNDKYM